MPALTFIWAINSMSTCMMLAAVSDLHVYSASLAIALAQSSLYTYQALHGLAKL